MATAAATAATRAVSTGRLTGEDAHGDTREGDVPHSVTDEGHAALDEEDPDERRRETGQQCGEQRLAHEVEGQQVGHGATSRGVGVEGRRADDVSATRGDVVGVVVVRARGVSGEVCGVRGGAAVEVDVTGIQAHDPADDSLQGGQLVGDDEHRRAAVDEPAEHPGQGLLAGVVDARRRLVHDEDLRLTGEGPGDEHSALLSAGEGGHLLPGPIGEPHVLDRPADDGAVLRRGRSPPGAVGQPADLDDLGDRRAHRGGQRVPLGDVPDPGVLGEPLPRRAEQLHPSALLRREAEDAADERGLPRAVRSEQRDDLTPVELQVDPGHDRAVGVPERRRPEPEERSVAQVHCCPSRRVRRLARITSR